MGRLIDLEAERLDPETRALVEEDIARTRARMQSDPEFRELVETYPKRYSAALARVVERFQRGEIDRAAAIAEVKDTARRFGVISW